MAEQTGTARVKRGMAEMLKGGVIMDVVNSEQAKIAEDAGAVAVMALERVPADIRAQGGVARMSDPDMIEKIKASVSIPVMAKARIGHFAEAQILESLGVDYIDESEVLTPADYANHIDKWSFKVPFVCGATNLGEALRRINEGAAMIRSKGEAGTGDVSNAVTHMRTIGAEIRRLTSMREDELYVAAKELSAPYELVKEVAATGNLPVVLFTAGGIATPADASLMIKVLLANCRLLFAYITEPFVLLTAGLLIISTLIFPFVALAPATTLPTCKVARLPLPGAVFDSTPGVLVR